MNFAHEVLHDSLQWWQFAIRFTWVVLFVVGLARLIRGKGNRRVDFIMMVIAFVGFLMTRACTEPAAHPVASPSSKIEVVQTDRIFQSQDDPAVFIEAPDGWKVSFRSADRSVIVERSDASGSGLLIQSSHLQEEADVALLLSLVQTELTKLGYATDETFEETIDGLPALGLVVRAGGETLCSWLVKRGPHYVTTIQCRTRGAAYAREACREPMGNLHWRTPARL